MSKLAEMNIRAKYATYDSEGNKIGNHWKRSTITVTQEMINNHEVEVLIQPGDEKIDWTVPYTVFCADTGYYIVGYMGYELHNNTTSVIGITAFAGGGDTDIPSYITIKIKNDNIHVGYKFIFGYGVCKAGDLPVVEI